MKSTQLISHPSRSPETSVCYPGASILGPHLGPSPSPPPSSWGHSRPPPHSLSSIPSAASSHSLTLNGGSDAPGLRLGPPLSSCPRSLTGSRGVTPCIGGRPRFCLQSSLGIPRNLATTQHLQRPSARGKLRPHRAQHLLSRPIPSSGCSGQNLHLIGFIETLSLSLSPLS